MQNSFEKLFTAGQFAKMHGIPKRTLMYYDDIGLLPAAKRGENSYRYYSYHQSTTLQIILSLRELNVSLAEINQYMSHRSPESLIRLLNDKIKEADEKIARLSTIKSMLRARTGTLTEHLRAPMETIAIEEYPEEYMCLSRSIRDVTDRESVNIFMEHAAECHVHQSFNHAFGIMIHTDSLFQGEPENYDFYYTRLDHAPDSCVSHPHKFLAGRYLTMFHKGNWDTLPDAYARILRYLKKTGLSVTGYAYEDGVVDEMAIHTMDDYVTRIRIKTL